MIPFLTGIYARRKSVRHTEPSQKKTSEHEGQEKNKLDFKK